jgi:hypothetical protein
MPEKKLKLSSDGGDSGKRGYGGAYGGVWRSLRLAGVSGDRRSVLCWCVWQKSGFSRHEYIFIFNSVYKEMS